MNEKLLRKKTKIRKQHQDTTTLTTNNAKMLFFENLPRFTFTRLEFVNIEFAKLLFYFASVVHDSSISF